MNFDTPSIFLGLALGVITGAVVMREKSMSRLQELLQKTARLEAEKEALAQQATLQAGNEKAAQLQFENLANRIFEEKTQKFKQESQEGLALLLTPLRERMQEFQKKVEDSFGQHAKEQFSLKKEIESIVLTNQKMTQQTENLTRALKGDVKAQGNWGEVLLEKILEDSGLRKDIDYVLQGLGMELKHVDDGTMLKPDVVVMLPEGKHVIIDAKASLSAYEKYCAAENEAERAIHLAAHLTSVRAHVAGLEKRRYQDTDKLGAPDFVLMFMPIEGAYSLVIQKDSSLHNYAWDRKIVIVCPSTLFATLRTVASVWRIEQQNKNAIEIARQGGGLYDKVAGFLEDMQALGEKIGGVQKTYERALDRLSRGPGNILKRTEDLKALGIRTSKKMPLTLSKELDEETEIIRKVM